MFDLALQVRLKQARNALADGRLDEAFAIATEKEIREHRGGQILLEDLVKPFLDRARNNLAEERPREALLDAERAIVAGGSRPESLKLRDEARTAVETKEKMRRRDFEIVESARKHLREGSLWTGQEILKAAPKDLSEVERLRREAEHLTERVERAMARAREHLKREEIAEALVSAAEAVRTYRRHESLPELVYDLKRVAVNRIEDALREGNLAVAGDLAARLRSIAGESVESREMEETIELALEARSAFQRRDFARSRLLLGRLEKRLPKVAWVRECRDSLEKLDGALAALETSPLGGPTRVGDLGPNGGLSKALTLPVGACPPQAIGTLGTFANGIAANGGLRNGAVANGAPANAPGPHALPPSRRLLLWVDGVGTYLVLSSDRISVGRVGSSARPDIALTADIAGLHAEILRVEDDYFVVASQGDVKVGGQATRKKLLSHGDFVELGPRCGLAFHQPTPLSSTAVLALKKGQRIEGDVRNVVLLKEHLILGSKGHIETSGKSKKIVISKEARGLVCRSQEDILLDGQCAGREAMIPLGTRVQVGEVTFTFTDGKGGRV